MDLRKSLEDEIMDVFDRWYKEKQPSIKIGKYAGELIKIEKKYEEKGMKLEEIREIRMKLANTPEI